MAAPSDVTTPQQAIDVLLYDDVSSIRAKKVILDIRKLAENSDWAEAFLDKGGIDTLLKLAKSTSGSVQGIVLQAVRALLVYVNALDRFNDSPELVDRMFSLLYPPEPGAPVNLTVAKAALELLNVICGKLEHGHQLIHDAAKKKVGTDMHPYSNFAALLTSNDLNCAASTLLLMNLLLAKRKAVDELKAKRLFFRWQQAGLMPLLEPLEALDDPVIQKQLAVLQRATAYTIPRSWVEAHKYKTQYAELKRRFDQANDQLFVLQQQQAKVRLMKQEFARAQTTLRALGVVMPTVDTTPHPTKRFTDGGGISLQQLRNPETEPLEVDVASVTEISNIQQRLMQTLMQQPDFANIAESIMAPKFQSAGAAGRRPGRHADPFSFMLPPDDDFPPPPEDDDGDLPPPIDDDDDDDLGPPPDDDDDAPPPADGAPAKGPRAAPGGSSLAAGTASGELPTPTSASGPTDALSPGAPLSNASPAASASTVTLGEAQVSAAAAGTAPKAPTGGPPPPPPPPPGKFGGPPPPPPGRSAAGGAAAASAPERLWYKGAAPARKMKPLHWDKWPLDANAEANSVWAAVHNGGVKCDFDYAKFEEMFCQKDVETKVVKEKKPEKILVVDMKTYQNLSIMLHKLPTIPSIETAIRTLDSDTLEPHMIVAMNDPKLLTQEALKHFAANHTKKPVEQYEPPEQFVAMTLAVPQFTARISAWRFTLEWGSNIESAAKPIHRLIAAMRCVLESKHLPYFLGLLLGFGNMMNHGNKAKGNAPAMSLGTLGKIDATKDNQRKVSLLQHMLDTARERNPETLDLYEEMKPLYDNVLNLKLDDSQKSVVDLESQMRLFNKDVAAVKKALEADGSVTEDPFVPHIAAFNARAGDEVAHLRELLKVATGLAAQLSDYLGVPKSSPMKPEEIFAELHPFVERVRMAAADAAKEKKRAARKGQKLDSDIGNVLGSLQNEIVGSG